MNLMKFLVTELIYDRLHLCLFENIAYLYFLIKSSSIFAAVNSF